MATRVAKSVPPFATSCEKCTPEHAHGAVLVAILQEAKGVEHIESTQGQRLADIVRRVRPARARSLCPNRSSGVPRAMVSTADLFFAARSWYFKSS